MTDYLPNQRCPETRLFCGGQPDETQLAEFATANPGGCVINLRPAAETQGWNEAAVARHLGLAYVHIPVAGPQDLTRANAEALAAAVEAHGGAPMLVHCASGQRAAALLALKAGWIDGRHIEDVLATGRSAGLTWLEPHVQAVLSAP
ncbi:MAG TPA: sulfur transferase domain-containing protein [Rhodanobacter sp.]